MKVAIVCGNLLAGGAERVISILANKFVNIGISVDIYTWHTTELFYTFDERVKIYQIPIESYRKSLLGQIFWFRKKIKLSRPNVVLSFLAPFNILTVFSLLKIKLPVLVAERNDPYIVSSSHNWFWKIVRNIAYKLSDGVLVQTLVNKSHFPKYLQKKATIIYNPVTFAEDLIGIALKQDKQDEIVSVTRLEKQKNVKMLVESFAKFKKSHPNYTLTIYGEGAERDNLEKLIVKLNLVDSVFLPGRKQNVHKHIISAKIFAMASDFEGMSNSLIEAMCLGLPCVCTKVSGAIDLIVNGENGLLVNVGDTDELTKSLSVLADNNEIRTKLGIKASELYEQLNVEKIAQEWLAYIKQFVSV